MQYYLKIFNKKTGELVGYYKETGRNCVSKLPKGIKYWNDLESAVNTMMESYVIKINIIMVPLYVFMEIVL